MKKKSNSLKKINYVIAVMFLLVGFSAGFLANNLMETKSASAQEIEQAKSEITSLYVGKTVDTCWEVNDGNNMVAGMYELTYRNLRFNNYANRAIITDCSDLDTLLARNKSGKWDKTNVNLQIGNRVNPVWQKRMRYRIYHCC